MYHQDQFGQWGWGWGVWGWGGHSCDLCTRQLCSRYLLIKLTPAHLQKGE